MRTGASWAMLMVGVALCAPPSHAAAPAPASAPPATATPAPASDNPDIACGTYTNEAERSFNIPEGLLTAISRLESGRRSAATGTRVAWPWTINVQGEGFYFETKQEAVAAVRAHLARGVGLIDVGCMQVNLYHHPTAFRSLDEAFDPAANVAYGAKFLLSLYQSQGSWNRAVAGYHSLTPGGPGSDYLSKVTAFWRSGGHATHPLSEVWDTQPKPLDVAAKAYQRGEYQQALVTYRSILKVEPDSRLALLGTALSLEREGHHEEAYHTYKRVLAVDPHNELALSGMVGIVEGWPVDARIAAFREMAGIAPQVAEVRARAAMAFAQMNDLDSAARDMAEAARLDPEEPRYMLNYATLSDRLGDTQTAARAYEAFLRKYSRDVALTVSLESVRQRLRFLKTETP